MEYNVPAASRSGELRNDNFHVKIVFLAAFFGFGQANEVQEFIIEILV
jgi:hypothetical protein